MISSIIIIGLILSMYIAWRMIRTLRKKQRKANYTLELQRRPSKEIWEDYKLETTDDKNTQNPRNDNSNMHVKTVPDTTYIAGDTAPDYASNNSGDRHNMLSQLKEKTALRRMKLDNLRPQH